MRSPQFDTLAARWPALALALVAVISLGPTPVLRQLPASLAAAARALSGGRPDAAAGWLESALELDPGLVALHPLIAAASVDAGQPELALEHLDLADRLLPVDLQRTCLRGIALQAAGEPAAALAAWDSSRGVCLARPEILRRAADAALELDEAERYRSLLEALAEIGPADAAVQLELAIAVATVDPARALPILRQVRVLTQRQSAVAEDLIAAVAETSSDDPPAFQLARIGQTLVRHSLWRQATWALGRAVTLEPGYVEAQAYLGLAIDRSGGDGLEWLEAAAEAAPGAALPQTFLGYHWQGRQRIDLAWQAFQRAAQLEPDNPAITAELAALHEAEGDLIAAEAAYRRAAAMQPQEPAFWRLLASFSIRNEVEVETLGLPAARNAAALGPADPVAFGLLGQAHYLLGDLRLADRLLVRSLALEPLRPDTQLHFGLVRRALGDLPAARAALALAAGLDPGSVVGQIADRLLHSLEPEG